MANVYGNNGNRWWVGLNVGSSQSTVFGTGSILSPNGYESLPSGNAKDDVQFTVAAVKNKNAAKPVTISVENISWYNINGPYATQAQANAAIPAIQKAHPAPGEVQQLANEAISGNGQAGAASSPDSLASLTTFLGDLTSASLWIRAAKILIGGALLIVGVAKLTGADAKVGGALHKATKIAPFL